MVSLLLAIIYLSFISLGLPDSLLGAGWPAMRPELNVPVSYAGIISMLIALCTIISSLNSDRLTKKFGAGLVTAVSVGMTALAMLGFSFSRSFWILCILALPYGLGAGSVDAALNNYVALHFSSKHMSWLHCMWGVGASVGPSIMGYALTGAHSWNMGYRYVGFLQIGLTVILLLSLPLWGKRDVGAKEEAKRAKALSFGEILRIPGAVPVFVAFFCYCALESTAGQWASSYFVMKIHLSEDEAASLASLFYIGITVGRVISGFLTMRFSDKQMIRIGQGVLAVGVALLIFSTGKYAAAVAMVLIGLGCAPIYPCVIHSTPANFGEENSQALVGVQMASAYMGSLTMAPVFGLVARHLSVSLFGFYLLVILLLMVFMNEKLNRISAKRAGTGK